MSGLIPSIAIAQTSLSFSPAKDYPNHAIQMIVPYAAGGSADVLGRVIAEQMSKSLGQNVLVELKPGAGGNIGAQYVAKSANPDGYTLLFASLSLATSISMSKLNFDPREDLVPVFGVAEVPSMMLISSSSPYRSLKQLVDAAKSGEIQISFGSAGKNTGSHLVAELFKKRAGIAMTHIPFKGSGAVYPDLIAERVTVMFDVMGSAMGRVNGGQVRALAITSPKRSKSLPDVPTFEESGYLNFQFATWFGFFARQGTPEYALKKLETSSLAAIKSAAVQRRLDEIGSTPIPQASKAFRQWFLKDAAFWANQVELGVFEQTQ